jgi:hypothetical protein
VNVVVLTQRCVQPLAEHPVRWGLSLYLAAIFIGGTTYALVEPHTTLPDGWYWATVVAPTVGFGDFSPSTVAGRWGAYQGVWITGKLAEILLLGAFAGKVAEAEAIRRMRHEGDDTADLTDDLSCLMARLSREHQQTIGTLTRLDHLTNDPDVEAALARAHERRTKESE